MGFEYFFYIEGIISSIFFEQKMIASIFYVDFELVI